MSYDRTVSRYQVLVDGQRIPGLNGMAVERQGPGDNSLEGRYNQRRIKAGVYTLYTQHGSAMLNGVTKYKTYGYTSDGSVGSVPRPSLRLGDTGRREGILIHPCTNYVWSIGCINLTAPFEDASFRIDWQDSRGRVISLIDLLRRTLGSRFPSSNNQLIKDAAIEIVGDPGPARGTDIVTTEVDVLSSETDLEFARADLAWAQEILETEEVMARAGSVELFGALAASMTASASLRMVEGGLVEKAAQRGVALGSLRGGHGENLWTPWLSAWRAAQAISEYDVRSPIIAQLDRIAALLVRQNVDVNDRVGQHSPMVWGSGSRQPRSHRPDASAGCTDRCLRWQRNDASPRRCVRGGETCCRAFGRARRRRNAQDACCNHTRYFRRGERSHKRDLRCGLQCNQLCRAGSRPDGRES
jgi:hypothetical protein